MLLSAYHVSLAKWSQGMKKMLLPLFLTGCAAYDLGSEPQREVSVNAQAPTFANDVGPLMLEKCDVCHDNTAAYVPANTPQFTLSTEEGFNARKARIVARAIEEKTMPPPFATGLTDTERAALARYIESEGQNAARSFK